MRGRAETGRQTVLLILSQKLLLVITICHGQKLLNVGGGMQPLYPSLDLPLAKQYIILRVRNHVEIGGSERGIVVGLDSEDCAPSGWPTQEHRLCLKIWGEALSNWRFGVP